MRMSIDQQEFQPAYMELARTGGLRQRAEAAYEQLRHCELCGWKCGIDRLTGKKGVCRTGIQALVSSYGPHFGEENPLRGWRGSGTIFFARCNMRCQYCQNYDISQSDAGDPLDPADLAAIMLELERLGCHNINLVSPSHVVPQFQAALTIAAAAGLSLPIVFNTGGYDSQEALRLLDGVIDIYMPDMKYASQQIARHYSKIPHYPQTNQAAVKEMHRQVGDLQLAQGGLAQRGLLIRHLVLPNGLAGTAQILAFIAAEISLDTYLNLMDQYRPAYNVRTYRHKFPRLARPITAEEIQNAVQTARALGLHRLD